MVLHWWPGGRGTLERNKCIKNNAVPTIYLIITGVLMALTLGGEEGPSPVVRADPLGQEFPTGGPQVHFVRPPYT